MVVRVLYYHKEGGLNVALAAAILRDAHHEGSPVSDEDNAIFSASAKEDVRCLPAGTLPSGVSVSCQ
jgi:hypothetical protein